MTPPDRTSSAHPPSERVDPSATPGPVEMYTLAAQRPSYVPQQAQGPSEAPPPRYQTHASQPPQVYQQHAYRMFVKPPIDPRATGALILGVASLITGFFAGLPAIILGAIARRDLDRQKLLYPHAPRRGMRHALAGITLGAIGTVVSVAWMSGTAGYLYASHHPSYTTPHAPISLARATSETFGKIRIVDLDNEDPRPFSEQLKEEWKRAHAAGKPLLLQTITTNCTTCVEIETAMHDAGMQRSLDGMTIVRVDVEAYEEDLRALGLWQDTVPWFYRVDSALRPVDAISADEWDDNTAENIAPVLGAFGSGHLYKRRNPSPLSTSL